MPRPRPVERVELNEEHMGRRLALALALLVFGAGLLVYAFMQLLAPQTGWMTIEANSSAGASCAGEFALLYCPAGTAERKAVTTRYTSLCRSAYEQFHSREGFEGVNNVYAVNRHPNEPLELDPGLYAALSAVAESGSRLLYLGPVYARYEDLFFCGDDSQLADFDPRLSEDVAREYAEILAYANDPGAVRLELLGENRVRLAVSEDYLAYAAREGIEDFIDFSWTRNAFIADYVADGLAALGYTRGALTSYDGFVRNLDGGGTEYSLQLYDLWDGVVYPAAVLRYEGPRSIVTLRDYPINDLDLGRFYETRSGEIRTPYLDPADALCKSAVHNLVCYAGDRGCGEILLAMAPAYIAGGFREEWPDRLAGEGISSILCREGAVRCTDPEAVLDQFYDRNGARYALVPSN